MSTHNICFHGEIRKMKTFSRYSLEVPQRAASYEYPQRMFSWRSKRNISVEWSVT